MGAPAYIRMRDLPVSCSHLLSHTCAIANVPEGQSIMAASRPAAILGGATSGAAIGRLLGIGVMGTLLGLAAGIYLAVALTAPAIAEIQQ